MIEIENVHKFFGTQHVLRGVSLKIENGKTTAIVGPSGAGKSVMIKIISGLLEADAGEVVVDNTSFTDVDSSDQRAAVVKKMGILFQAAALFDSLTVFDNVAFPLRYSGGVDESEITDRVVQRLKEVGLERHLLRYPGELSIGMRKRVGVARALVTDPKYLLFDEPNTGLDPLTGQELYDLIRATQEKFGFTGIVISHEIPEVFQVCDSVAMLFEGTIQEEGTVDEFLASENPVVRQFISGDIHGPIQLM